MGLFDKFRKKVQKAASEVNSDEISAEEDSEEAKKAMDLRDSSDSKPDTIDEPEWEEFDDDVDLELPKQNDDEWDEWDEEEDYVLPTKLSRKEKKILAAAAKKDLAKKKAAEKELKKRGGKEVAKLAGSKVNLHMMRTTTGRQLVEVKSSPTGSKGTIDDGRIKIDLGGGVVESGGRVIKPSEALDNLIEELEWIMLESDISSDAVTEVMAVLKRNLIGQRLRKGADISKVLEASLKRALRGILEAGYWDFFESIEKYLSSVAYE